MWEWLFAPIDPSRAHEVGAALSWHARLMVLGWGVLAPLAILAARFFKVLPGQDWPRVLDTQFWWRCHVIGQSLVAGLSLCALILVLTMRSPPVGLHGWLGYGVLALLALQILLGLFRGTKGGPTAPAPDGSVRGDHYDMTRWRRIFETLHKSLGYGAIFLSVGAILVGLWAANAPIFMWGALGMWWCVLVGLFIVLQRLGMAIDTYQAIWGDDPRHPGNAMAAAGWGMRRPGDDPRRRHRSSPPRSERIRSP